jgi:hypothetical protein
MPEKHSQAREYARIALACIRLFNGLAGLLAPQFLLRGLQLDPQQNPGAFYAFRLFGVRTVILGAELFSGDAQVRHRSLRLGVMIHASDTLAALLAGASGQMPRPVATRVALLSALNTGLALYAQHGVDAGDI